MVTESAMNMLSEMRMLNDSEDLGKELGILLREQRRQENSDREKELNIYRSGSAPPTVEGSLTAVGSLFGHEGNASLLDFAGNKMSEEELRSHPGYLSYYYSNVNLNPRLPPPLMSKEDWRFTQRLQGGSSVLGRIGDRRKKVQNNRVDDDGGKSLFSKQPGFNLQKDEHEVESMKQHGSPEWEGNGLIGVSGLGLGGRQRSFADLFQDDLGHPDPVLRHPSRPASRNAFNENADSLGSTDAQLGQLHQELASVDALKTGLHAVGASVSHSYAAAVGSSLSRSTTPDPQLCARAPSPCLLPVGSERGSAADKRNINGSNSFSSVSSSLNEPVKLAAALSGMSLSTNGVDNERAHLLHEINDQQNFLFNMHGGRNHMKQYPYVEKSEHPSSFAQSSKASYSDLVKGSVVGLDVNSPSLIADRQVEARKAPGLANSYYKRSSSQNHAGDGGSPSHYQNMDNRNSGFANYGLNGYSVNPGFPSMIGNQLDTGNLPPLFENAAAAAAMAASGMDSRILGGGLPAGLNMTGAVDLQNLSRMGNQSVPLLDPLYLQYLRSAEYSAPQVAALNDPNLDANYLGNSYADMVNLQKAYLESLISPNKSEYGSSLLGKSGSPLRHSERNMHFPSGLRNLAGGGMGSWYSEGGSNFDESFASSLLEEFKGNKTKAFELSEIAGHVVEFSADQYGSRFIQQKLETATVEEKNMVFQEIIPQALSLMTDVFGNYVIQKAVPLVGLNACCGIIDGHAVQDYSCLYESACGPVFFEHGTAPQRRELANVLTGNVLTLSLQMYGCRVIQKAIEVVDLDQQKKMVAELDGHIMRCRVLEHCNDPKTQSIMMDEILQSVCSLAKDQYGNYVVQHVLEHGKAHERSAIIKKLAGQIVQMSQQKFASNVVEKCLTFGGPVERQILVNEMLGTTDENEPLQAMMKDQFANYVVQKVLETCDDQQRELILSRVKVHLNALKKYTYGKHIVARVEKLVAAGGMIVSCSFFSCLAIGVLSLGNLKANWHTVSLPVIDKTGEEVVQLIEASACSLPFSFLLLYHLSSVLFGQKIGNAEAQMVNALMPLRKSDESADAAILLGLLCLVVCYGCLICCSDK
ncbi:hypothetical protein Syun_015860 [Stephania yunnanensis]|uniref:PUM-HD domain-containing protein n=1 Tax=Stephania yunnanensis TaxID=152371 RepID=A0AAP0J429_9MAGN